MSVPWMRANPGANTKLHRERHELFATCEKNQCQWEAEGVGDGVGFNDPGAWGFCDYCAFSVAVSLESGNRLPHRSRREAGVPGDCNGSNLPSVFPVPVEARPRPFVALMKLPKKLVIAK